MSLMQNLLSLFRVDSQVRGLRSRLESAKRYLNAQQRQLSDLEQQCEELATRLRQTRAKIANDETEVKVIDERIEKARNELNSAVNSKQYNAVLAELNNYKDSRNEIDERTFEAMEQAEQLETDLGQVKEQIEERVKVRDLAQVEYEQRQADVGDRLAELEKERDQAASIISDADMTIFDEMAHTYDGEAMAQVQEIDRKSKEYCCGACNMSMPLDAVSTLMGAGDAIVRCTACGRILYMHEETRGALAKK